MCILAAGTADAVDRPNGALPGQPPAIHILVHTHTGRGSSYTAPPSLEETGVRKVLNVVNQVLSAAPAESLIVRMRSCFVMRK